MSLPAGREFVVIGENIHTTRVAAAHGAAESAATRPGARRSSSRTSTAPCATSRSPRRRRSCSPTSRAGSSTSASPSQLADGRTATTPRSLSPTSAPCVERQVDARRPLPRPQRRRDLAQAGRGDRGDALARRDARAVDDAAALHRLVEPRHHPGGLRGGRRARPGADAQLRLARARATRSTSPQRPVAPSIVTAAGESGHAGRRRRSESRTRAG